MYDNLVIPAGRKRLLKTTAFYSFKYIKHLLKEGHMVSLSAPDRSVEVTFLNDCLIVVGQKLIAKPLNVCKQRSDTINVEDHIFCWLFKVSHVGCVYAWTSIMQAEWGQIHSSISTKGWFDCIKRCTSKTACWRRSATHLSIDHWSFWIFPAQIMCGWPKQG